MKFMNSIQLNNRFNEKKKETQNNGNEGKNSNILRDQTIKIVNMSEKKQIIGKEHEEGTDDNFMTYLIYFIKNL